MSALAEIESAWAPDRELDELRTYLGDAYDHDRLVHHVAEVEREEHAAPDERTFYRTSEAYLYDLTVFAMSPTKVPYHALLHRLLRPGSHVLDYGCGIGSDGLRLIEAGYRVTFADHDNPSTRYLRWRLERRGLTADVLDVEAGIGSGYDAAFAFDVLEHVEAPLDVLRTIEAAARTIVVNLLAPSPDDTHVHRPLDIDGVLRDVSRHRVRAYEVHHGRSHLVAYDVVAGATRRRPSSILRMRLGRR